MRKLSSLFMLAVLSLALCCISCKKEVVGDGSCTCTEKSIDGDSYTFKEYPKNYNADNCSELGSMLSGDGYSYNCK